MWADAHVMAALPNIGGALYSMPQFGWRPLLLCRAVMLPRYETVKISWGCPKLPDRSQPLVGSLASAKLIFELADYQLLKLTFQLAVPITDKNTQEWLVCQCHNICIWWKNKISQDNMWIHSNSRIIYNNLIYHARCWLLDIWLLDAKEM